MLLLSYLQVDLVFQVFFLPVLSVIFILSLLVQDIKMYQHFLQCWHKKNASNLDKVYQSTTPLIPTMTC